MEDALLDELVLPSFEVEEGVGGLVFNFFASALADIVHKDLDVRTPL